MTHWLITGANGNLGKCLIRHILTSSETDNVTAVVRSQRAADTIADIELADGEQQRVVTKIVDYADAAGIAAAAQGCERAVHLVGILKATASAPYEQAHQRSCEALVTALADSSVTHITYMSIVGSRADSGNACLRSKGEAEDILRAGSVPCCVLRVPMVLGEGDYASFALRKRASGSLSFGFRNASLEQPIYAGDVINAIIQAATLQIDAALNVAGPECVTRAELTQRAAQVLKRSTTSVSLPLGVGLIMAGLLERLSANPPVTRAMLEVLDHDDQVDPQAAIDTLQLAGLTPLDNMLEKVL